MNNSPTYSIIIPFRNRHDHLRVLIPRIHEWFSRFNETYEIIVVEQSGVDDLRRGALRNEGARVARGSILVFHDVDYLPPMIPNVYWPEEPTTETDVYRCVKTVSFVEMDGVTPRNEFDIPSGYRTFSKEIDSNFFGGVVSITRHAFFKANGYNPLYIGWGLEDDDFRERLYRAKLHIQSSTVGTFTALPHPDSFKNDAAFRRNQSLFASRLALSAVGVQYAPTKVYDDINTATQEHVNKWLCVDNWNNINVAPCTMGYLDYGVFLLNDLSIYTDHVQRAVQAGSRWEPDVMVELERYVTLNSVVLDIGANIGTFTIRASQLVGSNGVVYALEPQRITYQQLCANCFINKAYNVVPLQYAAGSQQKTIYLSNDLGRPGENRIDGTTNGDPVQSITIDSLHLSNISLIKVDVERYEPHVFAGMVDTIIRNRPVILFELTTLPLSDYPSNYVIALLTELKYKIRQLNDAGDYIAIPE